MRLAWKLTLGFVIGIAAVMAGNAWLQMRRQAALLDNDTRRDHWLLARAIRQGSDLVGRLGDGDSVPALIDSVNSSIPGLQVRLVRADVLENGVLDAVQRERLERTGAATFMAIGPDGEQQRYTYEILSTDPWHAVEISESLRPQNTFLRDTAIQILGTTVVLVLLCGGIALALGIVVVARPMRLLADKARRVGLGDFSGPLFLDQRDEIGELAGEVNAMCERLGAATQQAEAATAARLNALAQLRHADRLKTVGQLAAGVAHELGTPLNVVAGRAKMILRSRDVPADAIDNARIVVQQADRITAIVRQLLDFSRRRGATLGLRNLVNITRAALVLADPGTARIELTGEAEQVDVMVDQHQVQQAITNVVVNGLQAAPAANVRVRVGAGRYTPPDEVGADTGEYAFIAIEDDGPGISPEILSHVFEPFFTTKNVGEGTGLGLSVAYGIVQEHGGWIDVASEPGHGSRFTIFLPRHAAASGIMREAR